MYIYEKKVNKAKASIVIAFVTLIVLVSALFMVQQQSNVSLVSNQEEMPTSRLQLPSVTIEDTIILPFEVNASVATHFFDVAKEEAILENAVVEFEGVYRPSQGVDYVFDNKSFEVVAMIDGTVVEVIDDNLMGQSITVQSEDLLITYQSLSAQFVNINDTVSQGMLIGYAGENLYNQTMGIHLHIVCEKEGRLIDPVSIVGQKLSEIE